MAIAARIWAAEGLPERGTPASEASTAAPAAGAGTGAARSPRARPSAATGMPRMSFMRLLAVEATAVAGGPTGLRALAGAHRRLERVDAVLDRAEVALHRRALVPGPGRGGRDVADAGRAQVVA